MITDLLVRNVIQNLSYCMQIFMWLVSDDDCFQAENIKIIFRIVSHVSQFIIVITWLDPKTLKIIICYWSLTLQITPFKDLLIWHLTNTYWHLIYQKAIGITYKEV